ncbi:hypothetical protein ZWY2020_059109 [Hordeum vulgare]|nr:hypothetical protein ZWY2020_059109 [Hordeum vulgare]
MVTEPVPLTINQWSRSRDQPCPPPVGALQVGGEHLHPQRHIPCPHVLPPSSFCLQFAFAIIFHRLERY